MKTLDVRFLPDGSEDLDVAVVVDALRMTTMASAMLAAGAAEVVVVADVAAARAEAASSAALLFGERGGIALTGFDGGNSPLELQGLTLSGRRAVVCTTNGSRAVESVDRARHVLLGAIVNAPAVAARARELATAGITIVCAGTEGAISLDDVLAAGCIARALLGAGPEPVLAGGTFEPSDAARVAMAAAEAAADDLRAGLAASRHGRTLIDLGFALDVDYASRRATIDVAPERTTRLPPTFTV